MPDQGEILIAVDRYADAMVAAQKAAGDQSLTDLQAEFDAYRASHPDTSTPTPTPTPTPKPADPAPTKPATPKNRIGMSAPMTQWSARLAETGPVDARRLFDDLNKQSKLDDAASELKAGRMPVLSFKAPGDDWAGVASGKYDSMLTSLRDKLAALDGEVFVTLHHEPSGDGTPADYVAMLKHGLPILGEPDNVLVGPVVNGYWWSSRSQGIGDEGIAQWLPRSVLDVSDVVACDCYQGGTTPKGETAGVKIRNFSAWATRVGVQRLGIGEYNGFDAYAVTAAGDAILADPRYVFGCVFNSNVNNRAGTSLQLTGDRLEAFKATLAKAQG